MEQLRCKIIHPSIGLHTWTVPCYSLAQIIVIPHIPSIQNPPQRPKVLNTKLQVPQDCLFFSSLALNLMQVHHYISRPPRHTMHCHTNHTINAVIWQWIHVVSQNLHICTLYTSMCPHRFWYVEINTHLVDFHDVHGQGWQVDFQV